MRTVPAPRRGAHVEVDALRVTYPDTAQAALTLDGAEFTPGSQTWITGSNASGKSTLLSVLAGIVPDVIDAAVSGRVRVSPASGAAPVIGMVHQDTTAYLFRSVADEVAFPLLNLGRTPRAADEAVRSALASLEVAGLHDRLMHTLSGGERQKVAIAAALAVGADLLLFDEAASQLDPVSEAQVLARVRAETDQGATVILTTRGGSPAQGFTRLHLADGRPCQPPAPEPPPVPHRRRPTGDLVLAIRGLQHLYRSGGGLVEVDLAVHAGESVALLGPSGCGKTTLLKHAIGLLRPDAGEIRLCGSDARDLPVHTLAEHVGLLFQDPDDQLFNRTVELEVAWGLRARGITHAEALSRANEMLAELGLQELRASNPHELTGSQRQLVALASVLVREPRLLLLDEPTQALDAEATATLRAAVDRRLDAGTAVITVTHDLALATRMSDRWVVLSDGRVLLDAPASAARADWLVLQRAKLSG